MMERVSGYLVTLLTGLPTTLAVTAGGIALCIVASFTAGLALVSPSAAVRGVSRVYVEIWRGTSEVGQLFWIFFALPVLIGLQWVPLWAAVLVLGLNHGAYGAEIVRGAVQSVPMQQHEGAVALSMSWTQRTIRVILPQALAEMVPPLNNLFIQLLKASSLVSLVFLSDMTFQATEVLLPTDTSHAFSILLALLVAYLGLSLLITAVMTVVERWATRLADR
ncbi:MAG TPA: amino acid ABC transporter permease [Pseudonocardiaceae bacterium]